MQSRHRRCACSNERIFVATVRCVCYSYSSMPLTIDVLFSFVRSFIIKTNVCCSVRTVVVLAKIILQFGAYGFWFAMLDHLDVVFEIRSEKNQHISLQCRHQRVACPFEEAHTNSDTMGGAFRHQPFTYAKNHCD